MTLCDAVTLLFGTPCPGAITSLHFSHGHILVIWKLDAGVCLGVYWICSERRSSCSVKSKAIRASQLKDVKGKNLDTFDIRALVFPRHPKERQSKSRWPRATDLQPKPLWWIEKCELLWVYIYIYVYLITFVDLWWFMSEEFRAKEMNTYEYDRLSDTSSISSVWFRRISSQGKKAHFATTGNVAVWNLSFLWFWLASCWIVGWC